MAKYLKPFYKRERKPARDVCVFDPKRMNQYGGACQYAPNACIDANAGEVGKAIFAICKQAGVVAGRACGYEQLKDKYTIVGKSMATGKAQDFDIEGEVVAAVIIIARQMFGGRLEKGLC